MKSSDPRTTPRVILLLGIALASLVGCFWPLFRHPGDLLVGVQRGGFNDLIGWYLPRREYPLQTLSRFGQPPFWCPWLAGGVPFLGSFQTALFYPGNWPFWAIPARWLICWVMVGHHVLGGIGASLLGRRLGATTTGSAFAGIAFGLSPILLARTGEGHFTTLCTVTWYPWAFLAYEWLREGTRGASLMAIPVLALGFLAGHLQEFYYLVLMLTALCIGDALRLAVRGDARRGLSLVLKWGLVGTASAALAAAELFPLLIYLGQASDEARLKLGSPLVPGSKNLLQLILPFTMGTPALYLGPGTFFWETICYFGAVPLGMAVLGLVSGLRGGAPVGRIALVGLIAFVLGFGDATPLHGALAVGLTGYASLRCPGRWMMMTALAVAILGAFGIDDVARPRPEGDRSVRRRWLLFLAVLAMAVLVLIALLSLSLTLMPAGDVRDLLIPVFTHPRPGAKAVLPAPVILLLAIGGVGMARLRSQGIRAAVALIALTGVELALFSNMILVGLSSESFPRAHTATRLLNDRLGGSRLFARQWAMTDGEALRDGLLKFQGYEPLPLDRTVRFLGVMLDSGYPLGVLEGFSRLEPGKGEHNGLLDLWAVRYRIEVDNDHHDGISSGWEFLRRDEVRWPTTPRGRRGKSIPYQILENPRAMPRGFVVGRVREARPGRDEAEALRRLDPRGEVILERDALPAGPRQEFTPARLVEDTPNRVTLEVETGRPGYLVLADSWYPGWTATLDDRPAPVLPADVAFRAVALPEPGKHRVVFRYYPPGLNAGLACSAVTAFLLGVMVVRNSRRGPVRE